MRHEWLKSYQIKHSAQFGALLFHVNYLRLPQTLRSRRLKHEYETQDHRTECTYKGQLSHNSFAFFCCNTSTIIWHGTLYYTKYCSAERSLNVSVGYRYGICVFSCCYMESTDQTCCILRQCAETRCASMYLVHIAAIFYLIYSNCFVPLYHSCYTSIHERIIHITKHLHLRCISSTTIKNVYLYDTQLQATKKVKSQFVYYAVLYHTQLKCQKRNCVSHKHQCIKRTAFFSISNVLCMGGPSSCFYMEANVSIFVHFKKTGLSKKQIDTIRSLTKHNRRSILHACFKNALCMQYYTFEMLFFLKRGAAPPMNPHPLNAVGMSFIFQTVTVYVSGRDKKQFHTVYDHSQMFFIQAVSA